MPVTPLGVSTLAAGGLAELVAQTFDPVFISLRDTDNTLKKLLFPDTKEGNDRIRWHINANDKNPVRSVTEANLLELITTTNLSTTVGSGTPGAGVFMTPNQHPVVDANLDIRHLLQTIMIGGKQLAAIKGGKDSFANILSREMKETLLDWHRGIEDMLLDFPDAFRTTAATPSPATNIDGLGTMLAIGGTTIYNVNYAATYTEFQPYVNHNAGVSRALAIGLMQDVFDTLNAAPASATVQRRAKTQLLVCGAKQWTKYGNLLAAQRQFVKSDTMDGGFKTLEFNGLPLVRVPRFVENKMLFAQKSTPEGEKAFEYRVLKSMQTESKEQNIVNGVFLVVTHFANALCKGRMQQGILSDLN